MESANVNLKDPKYLPIDPNNMDTRLFTPEYMRMFGGYGALSKIKPENYGNEKDIFERDVGSAPDAAISASSTLFNYLTVTPGFTKVSSLNYQVYRDAKIQMYTPVRYCDKGAVNDGKVVLDSRGIIASMTPVSEKELPTSKQFELYQLIGDEENKRVNLVPDSDDEVGDVANVNVAGVYNPNFLFFVKVSDVTPEKMTLAKSVMTGRTGLKNQEEKKLNEKNDLIKMKQESEEKDQATSAQQKEKQEAITNALKDGGFMYDITDLLRDDRSVNFLNDALTMYDIYESPLVGGGDKTFVGTFNHIDVTCKGAISSFKLTLNILKPVGSAVKSLIIGSNKLNIEPDAREVDTKAMRYWVNTLEKNTPVNPKSRDYQERLKNFSVLEQKNSEYLSNILNEEITTPFLEALNQHKLKLNKYISFVAKFINAGNPFFKKIDMKDDSGTKFASYFGFDCYGYKNGVEKREPIYMGKLQSVKGNNAAFKKWYKPKLKNDANSSCDSNYSILEHEIYIFRMPEDAVTNGIVKLGLTGDELFKVFITMAIGKGNEAMVQRDDLKNYYEEVKNFFDLIQPKVDLIKKINNAKIFYYSYPENSHSMDANKITNGDTVFDEPFMKCDVDDIVRAANFFNSVVLLRNNLKNAFDQKPKRSINPVIRKFDQGEEHKDDGSPSLDRTTSGDFKVGDIVKFKNDQPIKCGSDNVMYSIIGGISPMSNSNPSFRAGAMVYHLFAITHKTPYRDALKKVEYAKSQHNKDLGFQYGTPGSSCNVLGENIQKITLDEIPRELIGDPIVGGAKHTRRSHTGLRKNVTRHGKHGLIHRRTSHKGRKRLAYSKTAKK